MHRLGERAYLGRLAGRAGCAGLVTTMSQRNDQSSSEKIDLHTNLVKLGAKTGTCRIHMQFEAEMTQPVEFSIFISNNIQSRQDDSLQGIIRVVHLTLTVYCVK